MVLDITYLANILIYLAILGGATLIIYFAFKILKFRSLRALVTNQRYILLQISVPKENEKSPLAAEQMFASLHGIYRSPAELATASGIQDYLSFEIVSHEKSLMFYAFVPAVLKDFVEGQIYAQYPKVEINQVEDYTKHLPAGNSTASCEFDLVKEDVFPIKTFLNFEVDPLAGITAVLSKLNENEQIWIQILVRPVSDEWQSRGISYVEAVKAGQAGSKGILGSVLSGLGGFTKDIVRHATNPEAAAEAASQAPTQEAPKLPGPIEAGLTGIEEKVTKLGFATKIRVIASAPLEINARNRLLAAAGSFKQFNTTNLNGFQATNLKINDISDLSNYRARLFLPTEGYALNIEELASIFHLPNISVETPTIVWAGSKKGEPPANLPITGSAPAGEIIPFGKTDFRNVLTDFGIKNGDRALHLYTIGKTGVGKTTMLENMAIEDIHQGHGVAIVDPHGDFVERILDFIPEERVDDVILFDPSDRDYPIGFNLLENVDPDMKNIVASGLIGIFQKIWAFTWGPRLEHILRNCILALLEYPNATLIGVLKMLVSDSFRKKVLTKVTDPVIRDFWEKEFVGYNDRLRSEAVAPIQNKVGQFVASSTIRNIVGQPKSTIDMDDILNNGKILLINLAKGKIGEDNSALLGAMMITKIQLTAMKRAYLPESERKPFYLYVDEFQNFATESFATIFSESRKYKLNLIVANQYIAQMPEEVREAVFGNVGTIVSFRVGASDSPYLAKEFTPVFEENDLVNLDKYHVYVKMAIDGVTCPAFSSITLPPAENPVGAKQQIIEESRQKYSRARSTVEEEIAAQSREEETISGETPTAAAVAQTTTAGEGPKLKGPSAIIKVGNRRFSEFTTREGERWYQEFEAESNLQRPPNPPNSDQGKIDRLASKPLSEALKMPQNESKVVKSSLNHLEEGKIVDL